MLQSNQCALLIPVEALKPRLQLQLRLAALPDLHPLPFQIYCTSLLLFKFLSIWTFLCCSTPTLNSWLDYYHYVGITKCEGRIFAFREDEKPKRFPVQVRFILSPSDCFSSCRIQNKFWPFLFLLTLTPHGADVHQHYIYCTSMFLLHPQGGIT